MSEEKKERNILMVLKKFANKWFIDAFSGMALGLFCTLIAGTIIWQIGTWCGNNVFGKILIYIGNIAKMLMGAGIGVGIAYKLKSKPLVIFSAAVTGLIGAFAGNIVNSLCNTGEFLPLAFGTPGNPIGSYVVSLFTIEIANLYAGKTKLDIVLIPLGMMILTLGGIFLSWPFIKLIDLIGIGIALAIESGTALKIIVGIFVAVIMGILLTMPTSSAAIWIAIAAAVPAEYAEALSIAGGAAVAGCAAHMIGFAVSSFRENKWGGLISQGIGTSMLQIPNIMKKPLIMVPEIIASAFSGLVAVLFNLRCNASGGGMGTSGLVGVFGAISESVNWGIPTKNIVLGILLAMFLIPIVVSLGVSEFMRKKNWIQFGDMKLNE